MVKQEAEKNGLTVQDIKRQEYLMVTYLYENDTLICKRADRRASASSLISRRTCTAAWAESR